MNTFQWVRIKDYLHYYLVKPHRNGRKVKDSFVLDFIENVLKRSAYNGLNKSEKSRQEFLRNKSLIGIEDFGAGSHKNKNKYRRISEIAYNSSSSQRKCTLLYNLTKFYFPAKIIELGTSLGIGTMNLSQANEKSVVYTLEGSPELYKIASENFIRQQCHNIQSIQGKFDEILPSLLEELVTVDMFFIDGNHIREATLRYFNMALKYSKPGSILIFDDIRWSEGMYSAWLDICGQPDSKLVIDLLDIGIVFVSDKLSKQYFRIYFSFQNNK